jgi:hypothetical protein
MQAFTDALRASIRALLDRIAVEQGKLDKMFPSNNAPAVSPGFTAFTPSPGGYEGFGSGMSDLGLGNYGGLAGAGMYGGGGSPTYIINASGIGDQQIASVVQGAIQDLNRYGSSTTYAGAI